ncbi:hypothetical protein Psch_03517 [Pelotomaculum schinkii]|uniref:Uncharacterized protein n=1 Tax=Pelotomaculum schinkii TaxID=78350 RepID=A0A4Y7R750_9FIRM|nr:hypothetical protein [Pelotomaculum schinkii]TEB04755.1 hypothetical protein Psch_03517 [Pelotomaculum schinkii]
MLTVLAQKLSGEQIENLVVGLHDARQMLHDILDAVKRREVLVAGQVASEKKGANEDLRKAETLKRLEHDGEYQSLKEKLQDARVNLAFAEAELEGEKAGHAGLVAMTGLVTAMVNAGQISDLENVEAVMSGMLGYVGQGNKTGQKVAGGIATSGNHQGQTLNAAAKSPVQGFSQPTAQEENDVESGAFMVLEARESKPGTIRGYCQSSDGTKVAIYAKNGIGQTLARAVGGFVQVAFRRGDKGLIASSVKLVS